MATNVDSVFFATQAAVSAMQRQGGGHIVQVSTSLVEHALQTVPAVLASLSKGACVAATCGLAIELAQSNTRVNAVSLGIIRTPLHEPGSLEGKKSFAPLNRVGEIADVVRAVLYLEDSDFVTGEISYIDGPHRRTLRSSSGKRDPTLPATIRWDDWSRAMSQAKGFSQ